MVYSQLLYALMFMRRSDVMGRRYASWSFRFEALLHRIYFNVVKAPADSSNIQLLNITRIGTWGDSAKYSAVSTMNNVTQPAF